MIDDMLTYFNDDTLTRMFGDLADALYVALATKQEGEEPGITAAIERHMETLATEAQKRMEKEK